jgi:peptide/nickel transport system substrate-binding protein
MLGASKSARKRVLVVTTVASAVSLVFIAIGATAQAKTAAAGRVLRIDQAIANTTLNYNLQAGYDNQRIDQEITEPPLRYIAKGSGANARYVLTPFLATSWKHISPLVWRFKVRPNVKFTNGEPLTAQAFKVSFDMEQSYSASQISGVFVNFKDIKVVNKLTFDVTTKSRDELVPDAMTQLLIGAPNVLKKLGEAGFGQHPVGTGPYIATSFQPLVQVTLVRNEHYWGPKPKIAHVQYRFITQESTRVSDLLAGSADLADGMSATSLVRIGKSPKIGVRGVVSSSTTQLLFNSLQPPFNNLNLRKALEVGINKTALINGIWHGFAAGSKQYYTPQVNGYQPGYDPYPYNPTLAKKYIAAAGAAAKQTLPLYCRTGSLPNDIQTCTAIEQQLDSLGLKVEIHTGTSSVVLPEFAGGAGGMLYVNEGFFSPELTQLFGDVFTPDSYFSKDTVSPEANPLLAALYKTASFAKRGQLVAAFQRAFLGKEALAVPLYRDTLAYGVSKDLNWKPAPNRQFYLEEASWK